jgi:glycolate oxidase
MASFDDVVKGGNAVANVIAAGIIPAGLEMMDKTSSRMVEPFVKAGYDIDAEAILLCESDGTVEEVEEEIGRMTDVLNASGATRHCLFAERSRAPALLVRPQERLPGRRPHLARLLLHGRHHPAQALAQVLLGIAEMEKKYGLRCANVFHAGDGNLHPLILFDANIADEFHRAELFGAEILELCVEVGGTITGEHGVGIEKINSMCVQFHPPSARPSSS